MEVAPGVHRVEGVRGCNVYLVVDAELTLIDAGMRGTAAALRRYLAAIGRRPSELTRVVLTHSHTDHAWALEELLALTPVAVLVHAAESEPGSNGEPVLSNRYRRRLGGRRLPVRPVADGDVIPVLGGLHVLHTPGHTSGSVCLFLPQGRVVFSGDTVLSRGGRLVRPVVAPGPTRVDWEASVRRLADLGWDVICCGHGQPVTEGAKAQLEELLSRPPQLSPPFLLLRRWRELAGFGWRLGRHK